MTDVRELLDLHDRLVAASVGVAPADLVEAAAAAGRAARRRLGYLGDTVLVALAGGTGSGKSSIVNALAGEEVSAPGARRPTTSRPVAWIPANPEPGLTRLLDDLGIERRVGHAELPWLAVLDLPDTDSVVVDHRLTVDRLLPLVDAVVWVVDPEKYKDARLHSDYLVPLSGFGQRFVFVLNQVDRLPPEAVDEVLADLRRALAGDGIDPAVVVATAADPPLSDPAGMEELVDALAALGSAKRVVTRRIVDELVASADRLVEPIVGAGGTGFSARWTPARDEVAAAVAASVDRDLAREARAAGRRDTAAVISFVGGRVPAASVVTGAAHVPSDAVQPLHRLVKEMSQGLDRETRAALVDQADRFEDEVMAAAETVASGTTLTLPPPPSWWSAVRLLSYGVAMLIVVAALFVFDATRSGEPVAPPAAVMVAGLALLGALRLTVAASTRRRVERALELRRSGASADAASELERRIGRPLRSILRARSAPGAAHTELMLAVQRYEETES